MTSQRWLARAAGRCLSGVIALVMPGTGYAADGRDVVVAVDQHALHARDIEFRLELLKAQVLAAIPWSSGITIRTDDTGVAVYIADTAPNAQFVRRVRQYLASKPQFVSEEIPAKTFRITYSADAKLKFRGGGLAPGAENIGRILRGDMPRDLAALRDYVRDLRTPLPGLQIEERLDGATIRSDTAAQGLGVANAVRKIVGGSLFSVVQTTDKEWRVSIDPKAANFMGPGRRRLSGAMTAEYLRTELRDPIDLRVEVSGDSVEADIVDPERHSAFCEIIKSAFSEAPDFLLEVEPAKLVRISLAAGATPGASEVHGPQPSLWEVASALQDLADPPIETSVRDGGIDVHTKDPARNADRMASLRKALAGRTDLLITPQPDQTLLISFASDIPAVTIGGQDQLIRTVQARVKALQLQPLTITGVPPNGVVVRFATDADASTFKRSLARGFGLAVRMVDEGPSDATSTPPSPGDERLPQGERGYLWLRPEAMLTGDMIADTRVGTNAQTNEPVIDFRLTDEGQRVFAAITSANVGRRFAIVLDGVVLSAPVIQSPILGGSGEINGNFTAESALVLAQSILDHRGDLPLEVVDR